MPIEVELLKDKELKFPVCPKCNAPRPDFMRGEVQRSKRFLGIFKRRDYCAVICHKCKLIIGWESPDNK